MQNYLNQIEKFLTVYALSWGMIALYVWVLACGAFFYLRYHNKTQANKKKPKVSGKFTDLIERLKEVKRLLMESDDHVDEAEKLFDKIEIDAIPLTEKYGDDHSFIRIMKEIRVLFDKAFSRLDAKERDQENVQRFMKGQSGPVKSGDDEMV